MLDSLFVFGGQRLIVSETARSGEKKNIFFWGATKSIETLDTTDPVQGSMCTTFFSRRQKTHIGGKKVVGHVRVVI